MQSPGPIDIRVEMSEQAVVQMIGREVELFRFDDGLLVAIRFRERIRSVQGRDRRIFDLQQTVVELQDTLPFLGRIVLVGSVSKC